MQNSSPGSQTAMEEYQVLITYVTHFSTSNAVVERHAVIPQRRLAIRFFKMHSLMTAKGYQSFKLWQQMCMHQITIGNQCRCRILFSYGRLQRRFASTILCQPPTINAN